MIPVLDPNGFPTYYLGVMRETTERKALQSRLVEADRLASLGTLVAGISHEINNPLSYILANLKFVAEMLGGRAWPDSLTLTPDDLHELRAALEEVELGAERVRRIVADLRIFARAEPVKPEPVDLYEIISASLKLARAELADRIHVAVELGEVGRVMGEAGRLAQVFVNLILNAAQAIPKEKVIGGIVRIVASELEGTVTVEISDNGEGIRPEIMGGSSSRSSRRSRWG